MPFFICTNAQNPILEFDGVDDHVDLGTSAGNGVRTIELWFRPEQNINGSLSQFSTLIAKEQSIQNLGEFTLAFVPSGISGAGTLRFALLESVSDAYYVYSDANSWNAGQWYHVAAVVHPTQGMMLFIDGIKQSSTNSYTSATVTSNDPTTLGCWGTLYDRYFEGAIDDVRLSNEALYTMDFALPCPDNDALTSTIALWNLNEGTGTAAADSGPNGYDATIAGATWSTADFCGNAIYLDGNDDHVNLGTNVGNGVRTIELWFNPQVDINSFSGQFSTLVAKEESIQNLGEFTLAFVPTGIAGSGTLRFALLENVSDAYYVYSDSDTWAAGKWYHVAAVVHPTDGMMLFIDGEKQTDTNPYTLATNTSTDLTTIGCWGTLYDRYF
ncbi:MAG: laminin G domain-containing protein, partial [Flavobacteriales bacterium]|nr:laminin G domain-containing protein [Flavobacteriales bacterium]